MRIISLFSGIGGLELGLEAAIPHARTIIQVEQNAYCRQILAKHWPNAKRYSDVREVDGARLPQVDLICGGFPCQDISGAGKGAGLAGARSGLWYEFARIIEEARPAWVVVENVASGAKRWVDAVRGDLGKLGYETLPVPVAASDVGAPHLRRRIFIIAHARSAGPQGAKPKPPPGRPGLAHGGPIAHAISGELRHERQRLPRRWAGGVRTQGHAEFAHASKARAIAHADIRRSQSERKPAEAGKRGQPRSELDGRSCPQSELAHARRTHEGWAPGAPVCGVDDGPSSRMDRDRLKALGNAVVPQCAQVAGEIINLLLKDTA